MPKTVLITGTSSGLGKAAAIHFANKGWNVIATMRNLEKADEQMKNHANITIKKMDITNEDEVKQVINETLNECGKIDVLYNNAGYGHIGVIEEVTNDEARKQFETNVIGVLNTIRAVLPSMRERKAGHIMNVSSMGAYGNLMTMGIYCSSKAALNSISVTLSKEVAEFGIKVTNIEPGGYLTGFFSGQQYSKRISEYNFIHELFDSWKNGEVDNSLGDVEKTVAVIESIAGTENPPLHLSVGKEGYDIAMNELASLKKCYEDNFNLTAQTD